MSGQDNDTTIGRIRVRLGLEGVRGLEEALYLHSNCT